MIKKCIGLTKLNLDARFWELLLGASINVPDPGWDGAGSHVAAGPGRVSGVVFKLDVNSSE